MVIGVIWLILTLYSEFPPNWESSHTCLSLRLGQIGMVCADDWIQGQCSRPAWQLVCVYLPMGISRRTRKAHLVLWRKPTASLGLLNKNSALVRETYSKGWRWGRTVEIGGEETVAKRELFQNALTIRSASISRIGQKEFFFYKRGKHPKKNEYVEVRWKGTVIRE